MNKVDLTDHNLVSGTFLNEIKATITKVMSPDDKTATLPTTFFNYQTLSQDILSTFGAAVFDTASFQTNFGGSKSVLPASSSMLIEVYSNGTVKGLMNDQPLVLRGCKTIADCQ